MKKILPIFIIIFISLAFFKPFFVNKLLPIPSDTIVGLYYPFRDLSAKTNPNGLPFHNFLITDPVRQQYPWRNLAIDLEKAGQLPLWNPYTFGGSPLLGNFQSAVFYPLNILFFIAPFATAWSFLIILEPLLGGLFLYFYLKNLKLHPLASLLGAIAFSFSGFSVAWMEWNTILHTVIWLPLILLAKDKLLQKWHVGWTIIFLFAEVSAFFGGHVQSLFYAICISNAYLFVRIYQKTKSLGEVKQFRRCIKIYVPFLLVGLALFAITAIQWIPSLQFINLSARNVDQNWHQTGWFIPWQNAVQFIMPDFFGNPATGNYWGIWNYAEFVGYIGIFPLILSIYALFFRHDKKTLFFGVLFFLSLLLAFPTFLAQLPFIVSIPFLSTAQPTRLLFVTDLSLAVLSALGLDYFIKSNKKEILYPIGFILLLFLGVWGIVLANTKLHLISAENLTITKHNIVLPTLIYFVTSVFLVIAAYVKKSKYILVLVGVLLCITFIDFYRFADKFETFASTQYLYPNTKVTTFLQEKTGGVSRVMATDDRILPPNFSIMYHVQTVDGYDPLYLQRYGELIAASERSKPDISTPFGFNRIITPKNYNSKIMDLLGVKYIISLSDIKNEHLTKVLQNGQTSIYENTQTLPRAFLIGTVRHIENKQAVINRMFSTDFDPRKEAIIEWGGSSPFLYGTGTANITKYSDTKVTIQTNANAESLLVFTDIDYPTWHASVDGNESRIFTTDYTFRGVIVPKGNHTVVFYDTLF